MTKKVNYDIILYDVIGGRPLHLLPLFERFSTRERRLCFAWRRFRLRKKQEVRADGKNGTAQERNRPEDV